LVAPFSSRYDIVMDKIGFPLQRILFLNNSFVTRDLVSEFDNKALIIHSNKDEIIPFNE
jgi:hypothetical protein